MTAAMKLRRKARGERPYFFADPNVDKVIAMVMGLAGEVAVMRDRLDTLERLLERTGALQRSDIDGFVPDAETVAARAAWRESFLGEVLRIVEIEIEALASGDTGRYDEAIGIVEDLARPAAKPAKRGASARRAPVRATRPAATPTARKATPRAAAAKVGSKGPDSRQQPAAAPGRKPVPATKKRTRR